MIFLFFCQEDSIIDFSFYDMNGENVLLKSICKEFRFTLVVNAYFKNSSVTKKIREFLEEKFSEQLYNSFGFFQLLDLSEFKDNNLKNMILSTIKGKNIGKPVLIDFEDEFGKIFGTKKDSINYYVFDNEMKRIAEFRQSLKFNDKEKEELFLFISDILKKE